MQKEFLLEQPTEVLAVVTYSVAQLSNIIKNTIEDNFANIRVRGEISGLKISNNGHIYFVLKDESAILNTICWQGVASKLSFRPEEGMEVICSGSISTYPGRSIYQLMIRKMEIAGVGALLKMLEKRKTALMKEGLFASKHKKILPFIPKAIGVITSPTGAVIRDILHRIKERFGVYVVLWGVTVQGIDSPNQIIEAITGFNNFPQELAKPELIIIARGGGSIEDLWGFNEESVVRAVFASNLPVISAIGHETDTTLIDYVADRRAPTPTAAAEIAIPVKLELRRQVSSLQSRLTTTLPKLMTLKRNKLESSIISLQYTSYRLKQYETTLHSNLIKAKNLLSSFVQLKKDILQTIVAELSSKHLFNMVMNNRQQLAALSQQLKYNMERVFIKLAAKINMLDKLLDSYNYKNVLKRGFAVVRNRGATIISSSNMLSNHDNVVIEFCDGSKYAVIDDGNIKEGKKKL